jgi:hypothetical protein
MVDRHIGAAHSLYQALQGLDRGLDVVFIPDRADREFGVVPGRWHVYRENPPGTPDFYAAITTEDGGYREPDEGVYIEMQKRDTWRHGIPKSDLVPSALKESRRTTQDEQRVDELAADLRAGARLPGDGGLDKKLWGRGKPKGLVGQK